MAFGTENLLLFQEWNGVKFPKGAHTVSGIPVPSIPETTHTTLKRFEERG
jgi:hypothetical protein